MLLSLLVTLAAAPHTTDFETAPPLVEAPLPQRLKLSRDGFIPDGYHLVSQPRWVLVGTGLGLLAGGYLSSASLAYLTKDATHLVPLAGPLIATINAWEWANNGSSSGWFGSEQFWRGFAAFWFTLLTVSETALQVGGLVTAIMGVAKPARWLERDAPADATTPKVVVTPMMTRGNAPAIGLAGTF